MRRVLVWTTLPVIAVVVLASCGSDPEPRAALVASDEGPPPGPVDEAVPRPSPASGSSAPTTSTTTVSSTTTTTAPLQAAGEPLRLEGSHRGTEHFAADTGRCPFLDHRLEETFTLADGRVLRFDSHYCGSVDANAFWTGTGTFTLTADDGSVLTGTSTSASQLPSTGEPYGLEVGSGTGQFAGATGACTIDNHLRPVAAGVQEHWGTFVCDLQGVAGPPAP
jgi:hypothetical protein